MVSGINFQQIQLHAIQTVLRKYSPEAAETLDIGKILNGSQNTNAPSGVDLSAIQSTEIASLMTSIMDMLQFGRMIEAMGMENPFDVTGSEFDSNSVSAGNTTNNNGVTIPGINDILEGSKITIGDNTEKQEVTSVEYDNNTSDLIITIGGSTFKRVNGVGLNNQNTFGNVFVEVTKETTTLADNFQIEEYKESTDAKYYYYYNGKMTEIDNVSGSISEDSDKTYRIALGSVVYNVTREGDKITLKDPNNENTVRTGERLGKDEETDNGNEVYKIGNATYELIAGVLVPRSTQMEVGGTIEIITSQGNATSTNLSGRVTTYISGEEFVVDNNGTVTTYTKYNDKEKKFNPILNIYTANTNNETQFFILEGTTLTQINPNDLQYHRTSPGEELVDGKDEDFNKFIELTESSLGKYFKVEEHGEIRFKLYNETTGELIDVTDDIKSYATIDLDLLEDEADDEETAATVKVDGDGIIINRGSTEINLTKVTDGKQLNFSAPLYTDGTKYYTFAAGKLTEVASDDFRLMNALTIDDVNYTTQSANNLSSGTVNQLIIEGDKIIARTLQDGNLKSVITYTKQTLANNIGDKVGNVTYTDKVYKRDSDGGYYYNNNGALEEMDFEVLVKLGLISVDTNKFSITYGTGDNEKTIEINTDNQVMAGDMICENLETHGVNDDVAIYAINGDYRVYREGDNLIILKQNGAHYKTIDVSRSTLENKVSGIKDDGEAFLEIQAYIDPRVIALKGAGYKGEDAGNAETDSHFDDWDIIDAKERSAKKLEDGTTSIESAFNTWLNAGNYQVGAGTVICGQLDTPGLNNDVVVHAVNPAYVITMQNNQLTIKNKGDLEVVKTVDVRRSTLEGLAKSGNWFKGQYTDAFAIIQIQNHIGADYIALKGIGYKNGNVDTDKDFDDWATISESCLKDNGILDKFKAWLK